jgi:hypothetical protein
MIEILEEKVIDRKKVADTIHSILDEGIALLKKEKLTASDHGKVKIIRSLGTHINGAVAMVQQETAMVRAAIVVERMKQLGFGTTNGQPQIES